MRSVGALLVLAFLSPVVALEGSAADLIEKAGHAFYEAEDMAAAEKLYRAALEQAAATAAQKTLAQFMLGACLGRQKKYAAAIETWKRWHALYPKDARRHYVHYFQGNYHRELCQEAEARRCWQTILAEAPDSQMAPLARRALGAAVEPYRGERLLPGDAGKKGGYLVVEVALDKHPAFRKVAAEIAVFHKARTIAIDGHSLTPLLAELRARLPQHVLFVVPPEVLDVKLHRRILLASAGLDQDIFPDFSFGYFTARDGAALGGLWARTKALHQNGLASRKWMQTSVAGRIKSTVYKNSAPAIARAAGYTGHHIYWGTREHDPKNLEFVRGHLPQLEQASVITMTGCGDPQGIWLFSDRRNADRSKHWEYAPDKVGHDPAGEMPRITAKELAPLKLNSPIVWTGVCHNGATKRVYVEGDIVSTFGRTDKATLHELDSVESFCLALIDAGATAFLCPIAANHGMSVSREVDFALKNGASLGETVKSTYDDIWLQSRGKLVLDLPEEGQPHGDKEQVMQGGGANRILIGDPSLRPFKAQPHPLETVEIVRRGRDGFTVVVTWKPGFHPRGWDMFGVRRGCDWTVRARVDLVDLVPAGRDLKVTATVKTADEAGAAYPHTMTHAEPEVYHGRRYLHLQANAPRDKVMRKYVRAVFHVTWSQ